MKIKVVFFDVGETLLYRNPSLTTIVYRLLNKNGIKIKKEKIDKFIRKAVDEMKYIVKIAKFSDSKKWDLFIKNFFKKIKIKDIVLMNKIKEKLKNGTSFRKYKDVYEIFNFLKKQKIKIGIISNAPVVLKRILQRTGILNKIDYLIISEEVGFEKPDKKIFEYALKKADIKKDECIFVGDNYISDIYGAKKAGIFPIWLKRNTKNAHFTYAIHKKKEEICKIKKLTDLIKFIKDK